MEEQIKEQLKELLKKHLTISVADNTEPFSERRYIDIELRFDGETISCDAFSI